MHSHLTDRTTTGASAGEEPKQCENHYGKKPLLGLGRVEGFGVGPDPSIELLLMGTKIGLGRVEVFAELPR